MSPGPATYRSKEGFDSFHWKINDVKSPDFVHRKRNSLQLFVGSPIKNTSTSNSEIEISVIRSGQITQQTAIQEMYGKFVGSLHNEIKGLKKGIVM